MTKNKNALNFNLLFVVVVFASLRLMAAEGEMDAEYQVTGYGPVPEAAPATSGPAVRMLPSNSPSFTTAIIDSHQLPDSYRNDSLTATPALSAVFNFGDQDDAVTQLRRTYDGIHDHFMQNSGGSPLDPYSVHKIRSLLALQSDQVSAEDMLRISRQMSFMVMQSNVMEENLSEKIIQEFAAGAHTSTEVIREGLILQQIAQLITICRLTEGSAQSYAIQKHLKTLGSPLATMVLQRLDPTHAPDRQADLQKFFAKIFAEKLPLKQKVWDRIRAQFNNKVTLEVISARIRHAAAAPEASLQVANSRQIPLNPEDLISDIRKDFETLFVSHTRRQGENRNFTQREQQIFADLKQITTDIVGSEYIKKRSEELLSIKKQHPSVHPDEVRMSLALLIVGHLQQECSKKWGNASYTDIFGELKYIYLNEFANLHHENTMKDIISAFFQIDAKSKKDILARIELYLADRIRLIKTSQNLMRITTANDLQALDNIYTTWQNYIKSFYKQFKKGEFQNNADEVFSTNGMTKASKYKWTRARSIWWSANLTGFSIAMTTDFFAGGSGLIIALTGMSALVTEETIDNQRYSSEEKWKFSKTTSPLKKYSGILNPNLIKPNVCSALFQQ